MKKARRVETDFSTALVLIRKVDCRDASGHVLHYNIPHFGGYYCIKCGKTMFRLQEEAREEMKRRGRCSV